MLELLSNPLNVVGLGIVVLSLVSWFLNRGPRLVGISTYGRIYQGSTTKYSIIPGGRARVQVIQKWVD